MSNPITKFELSHDDEQILLKAFSSYVAGELEIDFDALENLNLEISTEHLEGLDDLDQLEVVVTGVTVGSGPNPKVYLNTVWYKWPQELQIKEPNVRSFEIGHVEGIQTASITVVIRKLSSLLSDTVLTFFREEEEDGTL